MARTVLRKDLLSCGRDETSSRQETGRVMVFRSRIETSFPAVPSSFGRWTFSQNALIIFKTPTTCHLRRRIPLMPFTIGASKYQPSAEFSRALRALAPLKFAGSSQSINPSIIFGLYGASTSSSMGGSLASTSRKHNSGLLMFSCSFSASSQLKVGRYNQFWNRRLAGQSCRRVPH
jgi:hypothetical protein